MKTYELELTANIVIKVEADDRDEAETIAHSAVANLDSSMLEEIDVYQVDTEHVYRVDEAGEQIEDDDDDE